ncbi:MAG TPA: HD domain-containing protein [Desulfosporosinus sp.]|nr:HD domain-containing protein [Desulfosporosinus sp.]
MMTEDDVCFFRSWFEEYTKRFAGEEAEVEANLSYKKEHSLRVRDYMLILGRDVQLDIDQMFIAEVIGLFHDVGRFEQYVKYHTFKDHRSEDHAELGLSILEREKIFLERASQLENEIILTAIRNHNRREIHETVSGNTLLFCKLIRDADKLDIFQQVIDFYENPSATPYFAVDGNHEDERYSPEIIQGILSGKKISYTSVRTPVDIKLIRLSWLLDLTFPTALEIANKQRFLERIRAFIPVTGDTQKVFHYIEEQLISQQRRDFIR